MKLPKRAFCAIVEQAYAEGIGARRLARMLGYSSTRVRQVARDLACPQLPRFSPAQPSAKLLAMIGAVEHSPA